MVSWYTYVDKVAHADPHLLPARFLRYLRWLCFAGTFETWARCNVVQRRTWDAQKTMISSGHFCQYHNVCWVLFGSSLQQCLVELNESNETAFTMFMSVNMTCSGKICIDRYLTTLLDWGWQNWLNIGLPACVCENKEVPRHKRLWKLKQKIIFTLKIFPSLPGCYQLLERKK